MGRQWHPTVILILACGLSVAARAQRPSEPSGTSLYASRLPDAVSSTPMLQAASQARVSSARGGSDSPSPAYNRYAPDIDLDHDTLGSTYIPLDSWVYPAVLRLYSMGYADSTFLSLRPWTRRSLLHILADSEDDIAAGDNTEAQDILNKLLGYLHDETPANGETRGIIYGPDTAYVRMLGIHGPILRDSYHLGQTFVNDYGRPYQSGVNSLVGLSSINELGRFSLYVRGEYQHAPATTGYSPLLATELSTIDAIPYSGSNLNQATLPAGPIAAQNPFRLQEAYLSYQVLNHEISLGKSDSWLGPAQGGGMAWSNNAENIYSLRINRAEPLHIPLLSSILGPVRYDFFVGSLKGHTYPNDPWVHSEALAFRPTSNFEFGFTRSVIWGGHGHGCVDASNNYYPCNEPITLHTFLKSFFDLGDVQPAAKYTPGDPGARFSFFNFSWRVPFLRNHVTLYTDSMVHDDVSPVSAPRRAAYRPGVYISQLPGLPRLDLRVEAASTDTSTLASMQGQFMYYETIQRQGYTNKGFIMGDWIGREAKGGQAWLTWHLSGDEWVQLSYLNKKTAKDFIPNGTTQNQVKVDVLKRIGQNVEIDAWLQFERWKAPIYMPGQQSNTAAAAQITWYPKLHTSQALNGK